MDKVGRLRISTIQFISIGQNLQRLNINRAPFLKNHHLHRIPSQFRLCLSTNTTNLDNDVSIPHHTPIAIIGGGPSGLLLSTLLSSYNVPTCLFEQKTESQLTSHPQAHFMNLRTMELFRHNVHPNVTQEIWSGVPPTEEWQDFRFAHSVLGSDNKRCLAVVRHPVKNGGSEYNGGKAELIEGGNFDGSIEKIHSESHNKNSVCNVAHIGQHKFCDILIREAKRAASKVTNGKTTLNFNKHVTSILENHQSDNMQIDFKGSTSFQGTNNSSMCQTAASTFVTADFVVATDGAHSPTRLQYNIANSSNPDLDPQHLINVHFKVTSPELKQKLAKFPAMLYFIYNEVMISVFICHDMEEGNWVLQIPYMPPYQSPPNNEECYRILYHGLFGKAPPSPASSWDDVPIQVQSIRPWVMTATIANKYVFGPSNRIILAGDAAHTFPPAGGFGMNTGLQDVHNLAWRLALQYHSDLAQKKSMDDTRNDETSSITSFLSLETDALFVTYENERRPIAEQNESLSVRNYNRTVRIARTLGLDIRLSKLANQIMSSSMANFVPMSMKKSLFENAFQMTLKHLSWFRDGSSASKVGILGRTMVKELQHILRKGEGLPLIFPRFELGFHYNNDERNINSKGIKNEAIEMEEDTARYIPVLSVGHRMPHCRMEIVSTNFHEIKERWPNLIIERETDGDYEKNVITLTDISSQIRENLGKPCFSLLVVDMKKSSANQDEQYVDDMMKLLNQTISQVSKETGIVMQPIEIKLVDSNRNFEYNTITNHYLILGDIDHSFQKLVQNYLGKKNNEPIVAVLIRPDGHIAQIAQVSREKLDQSRSLEEDIRHGLRNCGITLKRISP